MRFVMPLLRTGLPGCCLLLIVSLAASAEEPLGQYFAGLRGRRLFTVAETEAQRRLLQEQVSEAEQAELTIELSKTYALHATYSTGEERRELWTQAEQIVTELLRAEPDSPFRGLLHVQRALVPAARGAQLRWQGELFPLDASTRADAAAILREAIERLRPLPSALDADLKQVQAALRGSGDHPRLPAPSRLYRLKREVEFAIGTALLDLAKVLPPGADRVAALFDADQQFDALTQLARPDGIAWQSRVHRLDILRLRGDVDRLAGQVAALIKSEPPPAIADAATGVLVRRWLDEERPDEALVTLEAHRQDQGLASEELQALLVETLLTARRLAITKGDAALAVDLWTQAQAVDSLLNGPWKVRSSLLLERAREEDRYGPELAARVREAQWAWQNGNVEGAITAYKRAAAAAHQRGETDMAVEFGLNIASAQVEAGRFEEAVKSLGQLLNAYPDHEKSGSADLLRAYALGRVFEQQPTDEHKQAYRQALTKHRESFAQQPTAAEATWMLARLVDYEQDADAAIALLQEIPADSPHYLAAIERLTAIFERVIDQARRHDDPTAAWEARAVQTLTPIVDAFPPAPTPLAIEQANVAQRLARILLYRAPPDFLKADALLERVIDSGHKAEQADSTVSDPWTSLLASASRLQIICLAGMGRLADARALLDQAAADNPQRMLDILNGLTEVAQEIGLAHRAGIGRMQLELAEALKSQQPSLPEDQQRNLDVSLAQAHAALGQWQNAARLYEELLWKHPKDRPLVKALAELYEDCGSPSCLRQATKQWQTLESLQRKGTIDWLQSRYHLAWCSHRLADDETARKLIGVTQVLYPQLGSSKLKARYEALAAEIDESRK